MPQKKTDEDARIVNAAIEVIEEYLGIHRHRATEAITKTLPPVEDKKEAVVSYTQLPAVNNLIAGTCSWAKTGFTMFHSGVEYANTRVIHNEELTQKRKQLAQACLDAFVNAEQAESPLSATEGINILKNLLVDNMKLSVEHLGKDSINSGKLYTGLRDALKLKDKDAYILVDEYLSESLDEKVSTP